MKVVKAKEAVWPKYTRLIPGISVLSYKERMDRESLEKSDELIEKY